MQSSAMARYIGAAICLLAVTGFTLESSVSERATALTAERSSALSVVGTMGSTLELPGRLGGPAEPFRKDNRSVFATEHIYELTRNEAGHRVSVRFLTCTDEGSYAIGNETFDLTVNAEACGVFYYTARIDKLTKVAVVKPLYGVVGISALNTEPGGGRSWRLDRVWNETASRTSSPAKCCFMIEEGNAFGGFGDRYRHYFVYQRSGRFGTSCTQVQLAAERGAGTTSPKLIAMPDLAVLEDVKTHVQLLNVSEGIRDLKRVIDELQRTWRSAGSTLQTWSIIEPLCIAAAMLVVAM
ncbi:hypothetical protein KUCAC02_025115 [Chaenocephalus aceratus]|nr:hypothetical protein KUCAC02_025115 [Chaenocephalus aceratus]